MKEEDDEGEGKRGKEAKQRNLGRGCEDEQKEMLMTNEEESTDSLSDSHLSLTANCRGIGDTFHKRCQYYCSKKPH